MESAVALWNEEAIEISVSCELATAHVALSGEATVIVVQNAGGKACAAQVGAGFALDVQRASGNVIDVLNAAASERVPLHVASVIAHDDSDVRHQSGDGQRDDVLRSVAKGPPVWSSTSAAGSTHE